MKYDASIFVLEFVSGVFQWHLILYNVLVEGIKKHVCQLHCFPENFINIIQCLLKIVARRWGNSRTGVIYSSRIAQMATLKSYLKFLYNRFSRVLDFVCVFKWCGELFFMFEISLNFSWRIFANNLPKISTLYLKYLTYI